MTSATGNMKDVAFAVGDTVSVPLARTKPGADNPAMLPAKV